MLEQWGLEILKGVGRLFLNPLLYWFVLLALVIGYKRIKRDRYNFGQKIVGLYAELAGTLWPSLLGGFLISLILVGAGIVFNMSSLLVLTLVVFVVSLSFRPALMSPGYTIAITYFILLVLPAVMHEQTLIDVFMFSDVNYIGFALMLGLFLIIEGILLKQTQRGHTHPALELSKRGGWIGRHHLSKLTIIPFVVPISIGTLENIAPFWPYIPVGGDTYGLLVFPLIVGFNYSVSGTDPKQASAQLSRSTVLLGFTVFFLAVGGIYVGWLVTVSIVAGIIGKEFINYRHHRRDAQKASYFPKHDHTLTVLDIKPDTPAARLNIVPGDKVRKVNGQKVASTLGFYEALQGSGAFFKLELVDTQGEVKFVQSAFYEGEHHELGIIFVKPPFRLDSDLVTPKSHPG